MKVCILIPPTSLRGSYGSLRRFSNPQPSIGVAYLAAVLEAAHYDVSVVDAYVDQLSLEDILGRIRDSDVLGISSLTPTASTTYQICEAVRRVFPKKTIVLGNLHPTIFPEESLLGGRRGDFIVHNEGEDTFLELCECLSGRKSIPFDEIRGISFIRDGRIVRTLPRPFIEDLDRLPPPAWHLIDLSRYGADPRTEIRAGAKEIQMLGTRGCPMNCTFCSSRTGRSQGAGYRMRSPKKIVEEMCDLHQCLGVTVFNFMDLAFPLMQQHATAFCRELIASGLSREVRWFSELRVKPLSEELVCLMRESGCARVCFGIESGNNETLAKLKKGFRREDVVRAVDLCSRVGIEVDGMFMLGLPGEDESKIDDTIDFALELPLRFAIFNLFVPYPGCDLYDELRATGEIQYQDWSEFVSYPTYSGGRPVYVPKGLTRERIMAKQSEAMPRFYLSPRFIYSQIKGFRLRHLPHYLDGLRALLLTKREN